MNKRLRLRWPASCSNCGVELVARAEAFWNTEAKVALCVLCGEAPEEPMLASSLVQRTPLTPKARPSFAPPHPPEALGPEPLDRGEAGASARREYEKRARRELEKQQAKIEADLTWRSDLKSKLPVLGHVAAALTPKPTIGPESQATTAWKTGEAGERRVAEILDACEGIALHDRRVPRSPANIDHIAVGAAGVYVIDAKKYVGRIGKRDVGGFFKVDERLYVRGRDRTKLVDGVRKQCDLVRAVLGNDGSVVVFGVLCFVGAEWPGLRMKPISVAGVTSIWPRGLAKLVESPGPLGPGARDEVARRLAVALPPA